jgi:hypothetical protein
MRSAGVTANECSQAALTRTWRQRAPCGVGMSQWTPYLVQLAYTNKSDSSGWDGLDLNCPQRPCAGRQSVVLLKERWSLVEGSELNGGLPLKELLGPQSLPGFLCPLAPWNEQASFTYTPCHGKHATTDPKQRSQVTTAEPLDPWANSGRPSWCLLAGCLPYFRDTFIHRASVRVPSPLGQTPLNAPFLWEAFTPAVHDAELGWSYTSLPVSVTCLF